MPLYSSYINAGLGYIH